MFCHVVLKSVQFILKLNKRGGKFFKRTSGLVTLLPRTTIDGEVTTFVEGIDSLLSDAVLGIGMQGSCIISHLSAELIPRRIVGSSV